MMIVSFYIVTSLPPSENLTLGLPKNDFFVVAFSNESVGIKGNCTSVVIYV